MTDSRNRQRARALRADASLEAKVAFVAEGIRAGRIPIEIVEQAAMSGNPTAIAIFPQLAPSDSANYMLREERARRDLTEYLTYTRPDLLYVVLEWASRIIRNTLLRTHLKLGNKSVAARALKFTLNGPNELYPTREEFRDFSLVLDHDVARIHEEHWSLPVFYTRPVVERALVINTETILSCIQHLWGIGGYYWGYVDSSQADLIGLLSWLESASGRSSFTTTNIAHSLGDALMGLPYGL